MSQIIKLTAAFIMATVMAMPGIAETRLKLGHVANTEHPIHHAATTFARVAGDLSGGELNVRIFPSSQLGKAKEALEGIQLGTVDISMDSIGSLSNFHPVAGVESMPYLFRDADHYMQVWNGPVGTEIKNLIADEANFRIMGHLYRGSRELTSNKEIKSFDDLEGLKIRVTPIKERLETWKAFGASPTPMAWSEVFTALQQGVIEAQENPIAAIHAEKLAEVQKYLILTSHMANGFTFVMNAEKLDAMPTEHQLALRGAALAAAAEFRATVKANRARLISALEAQGMEVINIDQAPFRSRAKDVVALFPDVQEWYEKMTAE
ncbi:MAG: TRAP transporter substrate-binding protein [Roseovarius sp.]|nr:TRAP transporter substrate-binding protein [Roseovarius sp.]